VYPGANLYYGERGIVWNLMEEVLGWPAAPACDTFTAQRAEAEVGCRIGAYGSPSYGAIWCDELSLRELP
jgi:hypothetical protein